MADSINNCHVALTAAVNVLTQFILIFVCFFVFFCNIDDPLQ